MSTISGRLFFKAIKATNLKDTDLLSNPDCYVAVKSGKKLLGRTKTASDTVNPVWQQSLHFDAEHEAGGNITLEIYDKDSITRDDSLGFITIPVAQLPHRNEDGDEEVTARLEGKRAKENSTFSYSISFRKFSWEDEVAALEQNNVQLQQNIERLRGENNRLEASTKKLHSEVEDLRKINGDLEHNVEHLHSENGKLAHVCEGFKTENEKFAASNVRLHDNVVTFQEQNSKLKTISDSLREENAKFKVQVDHLSSTIDGLETVKQTMQAYADADKQGLGAIFEKLNSTLNEQKEVYHEQQTVLSDTKTATKQQEKILLLQLHSQCQYLDADSGLNQKEFQVWVSLIPKKYLETPNGLAFSHVDKDRDGKISVEEFNALVEKLVQDA